MLSVVAAAALAYAPARGVVPSCGTAVQRSAAPVAIARREAVGAAAALGLGLFVTTPGAASASLDPNEMSRFTKALDGVNFLLNNWEKETQDWLARQQVRNLKAAAEL